MVKHGDFFLLLSVAAATVLREGFAADEELRGIFLIISSEIPHDLVFG